jgi:hypothetical protein
VKCGIAHRPEDLLDLAERLAGEPQLDGSLTKSLFLFRCPHATNINPIADIRAGSTGGWLDTGKAEGVVYS